MSERWSVISLPNGFDYAVSVPELLPLDGQDDGPFTHEFRPWVCESCANDCDELCDCRCHRPQPSYTLERMPVPCPGARCLLYGQEHQHGERS
jgi:hypothetical protein